MTKNQVATTLLLCTTVILGVTVEFAGFIGFLLFTPLSLLLLVVLLAEQVSKHLELFPFKKIRKVIFAL